MSNYSGIVKRQKTSQKVLSCLAAHVQAQMHPGTFTTIIHSGNNEYIRILHILIENLLLAQHQVYVFDYNRRIKMVYLQQLLRLKSVKVTNIFKNFKLHVILDEHHALQELIRLQKYKPSLRRPPVFFLVDPSALFGRLRGGVKQSSEGVQFQYDAAKLFAQKGYIVVVSDFGGRQFHRIESIVPTQLIEPSTLILQFLPRQILLSSY